MLEAIHGRERPRCSSFRRRGNVLAFAAVFLLGGLALAPAGVAAAPAKLTLRMVRVGSPGNRAVGKAGTGRAHMSGLSATW